MSRNTKKEGYKEYLALLRKDEKLGEERKNLGYRELEKPIHHGYNAYLELREDVQRRIDKEGLAYQYILKHFMVETWSKTPEFVTKHKGKRYHYYEHNYENKPHIRKITEREYEKLHPSVQKYFYNYRIDNKYFWGGAEQRIYSHIIPDHYLIMKVKNSYLTHQKVLDSDLEREISFVDDKISEFWNTSPFWKSSRGFKWFRVRQNRADRRYNKITLGKNLKQGVESSSYEYYLKSLEIHNLEMEAIGYNDCIFEPSSEIEYYMDSDAHNWSDVSGWSHDPYPFEYNHRHKARWNYW